MMEFLTMKMNQLVTPFLLVLSAVFLFPQLLYAEQLSIRVGAYASPPEIFQDDNGQIAGFWPEMIGTIVKKGNWQIEYIGTIGNGEKMNKRHLRNCLFSCSWGKRL
jgi:ABC-type amino acid transport substrate-binding protein